MKKLLALWTALFVLCANGWAGSNNNIIYNVSERIYNDDIIGDNEDREDEGLTDTASNVLTVRNGTFNGNIITGQSQYGNATQNELRVEGGTVNSSNLKAGVSQKLNATDNTVTLRNITVQANVVAGEAAVDATNNTVTLDNSTVNYNSQTQNQVVAGKGYSGQVTDNVININNASVLGTTAAAGYSDGTGEVFYNTVNVNGASNITDASGTGAVYGGYSKEGDVYNNQVNLQNAGTVEADLYGGYANSSVAERNLVLVQNGTVSGNVYGGYTEAGSQAYENEVRLTGGQASGTVAGGWANGSNNAEGNRVTVSADASLADSALVYGGYSAQGEALNNQVTLNALSTGAQAYGGYSEQGTATNNVLNISGAQQGGTVLAGGWAKSGTAAENTLSIANASFSGSGALYGGYGSTASNNTLGVANSTLSGTFYGGYAQTGSATGNRFSASGSTFSGNVYGGYAAEGEASGNTVELNDVQISGDVYGGYTTSASTETATSNNTVVLSGNTVVKGEFYGGNGTVAQGNHLLLRNYTGTVNGINSFDNVTIYGLNSNVTFKENVNDVNVVLYGRPSDSTQTLAYTPGNSTMALNRDSLGAYAYTLESASQGAQTVWTVKGQYKNDLAKPYAQSQLAALTLVTQGDEMLGKVFDEAVKLKTDNDTFAGVQYYDNSYETGSGFDMQSFAVQGGRWFKAGENVLGLFAQYGYGHYTTDPLDASGEGNSFALGGFALLPYSDEGRWEFVARAGYQKTDFSSDELSSDLNQSSFYGGLSAGLVQNISALQLYGKVNWLYLAGDSVNDNLDQDIKFKNTQSLTGRFGARLNLGTWANRYQPYVGVNGIYEFDADSNVTVDGHRVNDVDLGGLTGQAEIGVSYENNETLMPLKSSLSVFGLTGQAEGWGANVRLAFSF